jgi:hypothetical protein
MVIVFLLIISCLAVAGVLVLDQGLSGESAANPASGLVFIIIGLGFIAWLVVGKGGGSALAGAGVMAALPIVLAVAYFAYNQMQWHYRPEAVENRDTAANIACVVEKAGLEERDRLFVLARIRMIAKWKAPAHQKEIEERMKIQILPNCQFERVA